MAVYAITGKLGSGKGKAAIDQIRRYLTAGKRVATNCDVFLDHLMPKNDKSVVTRIPDKPTSVDLYLIGSGNKFISFEPSVISGKSGLVASAPAPVLLPGFDECHNGALLLDECGSWLNTRDFQDKGRKELLEWAIHARKYGWDVFFIMQNISQVDKQLRDSLLEYVVRLNRLDRMKIPVVSSAIKLITAGMFDGSLMRVHVGVVRLGSLPDALVADRWIFRGDDLNDAYNTTQVFSDAYPHGTHSVLSSWHLSAVVGLPPNFCGPCRPGRRDEYLLSSRAALPKPPHKHMTKFLFAALCFGSIIGFFGSRFVRVAPSSETAVVQKFSETIRGVGFLRVGGRIQHVILSDGRVVYPDFFRVVPGGWEARIGDLWVKGGV